MKLFLIALFTITSLNLKAETLEQAIAKTTRRYNAKQAKKSERLKITEKYKAQVKAIREKQKAEIEAMNLANEAR